jgi:hypothetical protein
LTEEHWKSVGAGLPAVGSVYEPVVSKVPLFALAVDLVPGWTSAVGYFSVTRISHTVLAWSRSSAAADVAASSVGEAEAAANKAYGDPDAAV